MRRVAGLIVLGCLCGCGGTAKKEVVPGTFVRGDMGQSYVWMHSVYDQVREAEERGNELLVAEAAEEAAKQLQTAVGQEVEWTLLVDSVRRAAAGDPEVPENQEARPGSGYVLVFDPPEFQKDEDGGDLFSVYFSRTAAPQESHPYLIHLDEGDREYARTLTRGSEVTVTGKVAKVDALDESGTGFWLVLVNARVVRK
jgi:hypothetical protein